MAVSPKTCRTMALIGQLLPHHLRLKYFAIFKSAYNLILIITLVEEQQSFERFYMLLNTF